jgi:hypothetical protein
MNSNQTQTQTQTQNDNKKMEVNPLQLLVNASFIAYQRGAFSMKETSLISQAIDYFVETKQAVIPQVQNQQQNQQQKQSESNSNPNISLQINEQELEKVIFTSQ